MVCLLLTAILALATTLAHVILLYYVEGFIFVLGTGIHVSLVCEGGTHKHGVLLVRSIR